MITAEDVTTAARRIAGAVRRTPMLQVTNCLEPLGIRQPVWLKLENLQVTGSFKARGATNRLMTSDTETLARGIVTASGGNHGLAVARAGRTAGVRTTVFLPSNAAPIKREKLALWGADVRVVGSVFDEADEAARAFASREGAAYFHPFADPAVVAGQGTVALEILEDRPEADLFLIAIGGGGLIAGMGTLIRSLRPGARIVGVEPVGSPTLHGSLAAGRATRVPKVTTRVATMACGMTDPRVYDRVAETVDEVVLVEDDEMQAASRWLWFEHGLAADLSASAGIAALRSGRVDLKGGETICTLVCGAGDDAIRASA